MFNPADFDALKNELEKQFLRGPVDSNSAEYVSQRRAIATTRRLAESFGMMTPEPAPVRLCQECGAAPVNGPYSRLCEACYAIACEEIRAELAQEQEASVLHTMLSVLTEPLKHGRAMYTLPPSNTFADDLDTIARVLHTYGYITSAIDVADKAQQIRAIVAKSQQSQSEDK